jgi:hypothetical protein
MKNNKLFYGVALMFLAFVVLFLGYKISNKTSFHFGPNKVGVSFNKESTLLDSQELTEINAIASQCNCDIEIIPSEKNSVEFSYNKEHYKNNSHIEEKKLIIDFDNLHNNFLSWDNDSEIKIKVYTNHLESIEQEGIGSIENSNVLESENISLHNDGVGSMDLHIKTDTIRINNSGVGSIAIEGNANNATLINEGTGSIDAYKLLNKIAKVSNSGVGSVEVYASESFDLSNEGVGGITYSGAGIVTNIHSEGVGSIDKK